MGAVVMLKAGDVVRTRGGSQGVVESVESNDAVRVRFNADPSSSRLARRDALDLVSACDVTPPGALETPPVAIPLLSPHARSFLALGMAMEALGAETKYRRSQARRIESDMAKRGWARGR